MNLASSGKLKMRAKALLAEGTPDEVFRACVLLHEAARIQRRAVEALPACPPVTALSSLVEECWCFIEGRDPPLAAEAWGNLLRAKERIDAPTAEAVVERVTPRFEASQRAFSHAVASSPAIMTIAETGVVAGLSRAGRTKARKELSAVLARFPGTTNFWWMQYRLAELDDSKREAWAALSNARLLAPNNPRFLAMSLVVAAWALPPAAAEEHLKGVRGSLERAGAEVCLMYAHAEIALARVSSVEDEKLRLGRAREAADAGIAQAHTQAVRRNLTVVQLLLRELLAGREPTMQILYRAGLGGVASMENPDANVVDFLSARARRVGLGAEVGEAAA